MTLDRNSPTFREDFLAHYGVPGMRWGKRKSGGRNPQGKRPSAKPHEDHKNTEKALKKPIHSLSTKQIKAVNDRLQSEKKLKDLQKTERMKTGAKIVAGVLAAGAAATTISKLINNPAVKKGAQVLRDRKIAQVAAGAAAKAMAGTFH